MSAKLARETLGLYYVYIHPVSPKTVEQVTWVEKRLAGMIL